MNKYIVSHHTVTRYPSLPVTLTPTSACVCVRWGGGGEANGCLCRGSGFGLQEFEEQFVHGHAAVLLDAAEVLDGAGGRLAEEGEGHDQFAGPAGVLRVVGGLVVLQGPVEDVLESLNRLRVLNLHGV